MLGTVLLLLGGVAYFVYSLIKAESLKHPDAQQARVRKKDWTRFALPTFAVAYMGVCAWYSADDWKSAAMPMAEVKSLNDDTFRGATLVNHALVLDVGASWCVSCKKTAPEFAKLSTQHHDAFRCFTLDIDKSPITARLLKVELMPCIVIFVEGKEVARRTGPATEAELHSWVDATLKL